MEIYGVNCATGIVHKDTRLTNMPDLEEGGLPPQHTWTATDPLETHPAYAERGCSPQKGDANLFTPRETEAGSRMIEVYPNMRRALSICGGCVIKTACRDFGKQRKLTGIYGGRTLNKGK